jgi:ATP-dependent Zn protease
MNYISRTTTLILLGSALHALAPSLEGKDPLEDTTATHETDFRSKRINTILVEELKQLEEVNSILQYLGQMVNKGTIPIENKEELRKWLRTHQEEVRKLEKECTSTDINEEALKSTILVTKALMLQILETLVKKFEQLEPFEFSLRTKDPTSSDSSAEPLEACSTLLKGNGKIMSELKEQANLAGLTPINILARRIDDINNRYHLTTLASYLPYVAVGGTMLLHFIPHRYVAGLPLLDRLKTWISGENPQDILNDEIEKLTTRRDEKKDATTDIRAEEKGKFDALIQERWNKKAEIKADEALNQSKGAWHKVTSFLDNFSNSPSIKALTLVAGPLLMANKTDIPFYGEFQIMRGRAKRTLSSYWNYLKGYALHDKSEYELFEDITLDDERLVGIDSQVEELRNLVRYVLEPEIYDRSNTNLEKGVLLTGPSRCGKTFAAQALSGTINKAFTDRGSKTKFKFIEVKWREFFWKKDGIKTIIEDARHHAPCVLFIDEIHNLPLQTKEGGETLTEFLTGMSGINTENDSRHQVILLAATNQPEKLDSALLQPGRFGTIIRFEKPKFENRKKYFEVMFKYNAIDTVDFDINSLARQTGGCSYGDLETIVRNARFTARTHARKITQEHLQQRIDQHVYRLKNDIPLTQEERKLIATHLAGHALVYMLLDTAQKLELVTIKGQWRKIKEVRFADTFRDNNKDTYALYKQPQTKYGGLFTYNETETVRAETKDQKINKCKMHLAGALAEELLLGATGYSYHPKDMEKAVTCAKDIVFKGKQEKDLPKVEQEALKQETDALVKQCEREVKELLTHHKELLAKIAQGLEEKVSLRAPELQELATAA